MFIHVKDAIRQGHTNVMIWTGDTDVVVLAIKFFIANNNGISPDIYRPKQAYSADSAISADQRLPISADSAAQRDIAISKSAQFLTQSALTRCVFAVSRYQRYQRCQRYTTYSAVSAVSAVRAVSTVSAVSAVSADSSVSAVSAGQHTPLPALTALSALSALTALSALSALEYIYRY